MRMENYKTYINMRPVPFIRRTFHWHVARLHGIMLWVYDVYELLQLELTRAAWLYVAAPLPTTEASEASECVYKLLCKTTVWSVVRGEHIYIYTHRYI